MRVGRFLLILLFGSVAAFAEGDPIDYRRVQAEVRNAAYSGDVGAQRLYGAALARDPLADRQQQLEGLQWLLLAADAGDRESAAIVPEMDRYRPDLMARARDSYDAFKAALPIHLLTQKRSNESTSSFPDQQKIEGDRAAWVASVGARIRKFWRKPMGSPEAFFCTVQIEQDTSGKVLDARMVKSCGSEAVDLSVVRAARTVSTIPLLPASVPFESTVVIAFCSEPQACK